jgi:tRNA(fMet)-specific endonuclease VapC
VILDTNAISAMADGDSAIGSVSMRSGGVFIPVVVLGEYRFGLRRSRNRVEYEGWLTGALKVWPLLPIVEATAEVYADIRGELQRGGRPIPTNDLWIAALARQHKLPVLSRDRHFDVVPGLKRIAW